MRTVEQISETMIKPSPAELQIAQQFLSEFRDARNIDGDMSMTCIYRSADFSDERLVYRVTTSHDTEYALKIDVAPAPNPRLSDEFKVLTRLVPHFEHRAEVDVVKPLYLSPSARFLVTEFVDHKTATHHIFNSKKDAQAGQMYRRAGHWLHELHDIDPPSKTRFWFDWMFEAIEEKLSAGLPMMPASDYRPMIEQMKRDVECIKQFKAFKRYCHGDFHGENLIMGRGTAFGLDFTEHRVKLGEYDIVDFLKGDVYRSGNPLDVDRSGILRSNKEMFFKRYKHRINMAILDYCIRARMLIDCLHITQNMYKADEFQRTKYRNLHNRLTLAFRTPIEG
ncbi:hypothetical protein DS909_09155 [Phaeobacter gallaeciensis]|uniref:Aminoglycoside phosphotransferase domain-containing protein n=2 Tax=Roseobacteraceae TaxID=2854170 RepID=A0A366X3A9_9RHOB|nr:hypothetical protein DS909_09155 [Phaeobacter gallaeciensis]